jgi:hypothetical protein
MKRTILRQVKGHPGKKFSVGPQPRRIDSPQYMVCYLSEQFPRLTDENVVPVADLKTGEILLTSTDAEIWLFDLV